MAALPVAPVQADEIRETEVAAAVAAEAPARKTRVRSLLKPLRR